MRLWKRNCWSLAVIALLILILINLAEAKNISLEFPQEAYFGEEFQTKVFLREFPVDTYSIKLDILTEQNRIAQIYNPTTGKYQSTYYYINYIFEPKQDGVLLKINITKKYQGEADIDIKIRDSKGKVDELNGYKINISIRDINKSVNQTEAEVKNVVVNEKVDKEIEENKTINEALEKQDEKSEIIKDEKIEQEIEQLADKTNNTSIIYLNKESKDIKEQNESKILFKSSNQKIREYAIIGFVFFCIVLVILIIIERKNESNN